MFSNRINIDLSDNRFFRVLKEAERSGIPLIDLTVSNPTLAGIPYPRQEISASLTLPEIFNYQPAPSGTPGLRQAITDMYRSVGAAVPPADVHVTASTSESYAYLIKLLCNPGDEILIPSPGYPLLEPLASLESVRFIPYQLSFSETGGWHIREKAIQRVMSTKTKALVVVNPNNPTGSYLKRGELELLNNVCREHGMGLIVDEVFSDFPLNLKPGTVQTCAGNSGALTFVLNGLSKLWGLPQLKLGWICLSGPEQLCREAAPRLEYIADTYLSAGGPAQAAAEVLLRRPNPVQEQICRRISENFKALERAFSPASGYTVPAPEGGWYALLRLPGEQKGSSAALSLLKENNVVTHPGYFYDFPEDDCLVLSLITPPDIFRKGISVIASSAGGPFSGTGRAPDQGQSLL